MNKRNPFGIRDRSHELDQESDSGLINYCGKLSNFGFNKVGYTKKERDRRKKNIKMDREDKSQVYKSFMKLWENKSQVLTKRKLD